MSRIRGPRPLARPLPSPSPAITQESETLPLNIRKVNASSSSNSDSISPPVTSPSKPKPPAPPLLRIPVPPSRATTPKPRIQIAIPLIKDEAEGGYYSGGPMVMVSSGGPIDESTIRPPSASNTIISSKQDKPIDIHTVISQIENDAPPTDWSDDVLEEIGRLGEGAGGAVHKVKDRRTGKVMARKTITTREAPMKQLERELSIMSSTQHVNIIQFYGVYISPSSSEVKILMDFCEGGSLESVGKQIKERNAIVGERIAGRLAEGVLQGLAYLHTKKTIHRDIKPSNILLSKEGIVKLCDFGVSGSLEGSIAYTFTGTSFYMAPERISGNEYTIRSDVWSTGISLLELVQNRFPFPNDLPPIELMMYITHGEPPQLEDESGVVWSPEMKDFIKQTLTVDPSRRPTPKDMLLHPWILKNMKEEVNMHRWVRQVWDWKKPSRSKDDASRSRPSTANGHSRPPSSDPSPKAEDA